MPGHAVGRVVVGLMVAVAVGLSAGVAGGQDRRDVPLVEDRIAVAGDTNSVGSDVDLADGLLVVGVPQARFGAGEVQVYRYRCGWELEAVLRDPSEPEPSSANLGRLVATDGEVIASGAPVGAITRGGPLGTSGTFVFEQVGPGFWEHTSLLATGSPFDLAVDGGRIGTLDAQGTPQVHRRTTTGDWVAEQIDVPQDASDGRSTGIDLDGDLLVTAANDGRVVVYERRGDRWSPDAHLDVPSLGHYGGEFAEFATVAVDGDRIAIGTTIGFEGAVHLFERDGDAWAGPTTIQAPEPEFFDRFGLDVALDGDRLVVGDGATGLGGTDIGFPIDAPEGVTVHERVGRGRWELRDDLAPSGARVGDDGSTAPSAAINGGRLAVGLPTIDGRDRGGVVVLDDLVAVEGSEAPAYWLVTADGHLCGFGEDDGPDAIADRRLSTTMTIVDAELSNDGVIALGDDGSMVAVGVRAAPARPTDLDGDPVAVMPDPDGTGAWVVSSTGDVAAIDADDVGSLDGLILNAPIVDATRTSDGEGLLLLAADGGVFALGSATFHGSIPGVLPLGTTLAAPVVSMVADPDGEGYVIFAADGGAFAFDADFHGSVPGVLPAGATLAAPIIGATTIAATPTEWGYLMVGADGGVFAFGDAGFLGSLGGNPPASPVVSLLG